MAWAELEWGTESWAGVEEITGLAGAGRAHSDFGAMVLGFTTRSSQVRKVES